MRKFVLSMTALAAILAGGLVTAPRAEAFPVAPGVVAPVAGEGLLQDAAYICRPIWRCGRYGCGWRRVCYWRPGPVWRPHWRWHHRHWRRW